MNKRTVYLLIALVIIFSAYSEPQFFANDSGYYFTVYTNFGQYIDDFILSLPYIIGIEESDGYTTYQVDNESNWYWLQGSGIYQYIRDVEAINIRNEQMVQVFPDNLPPPLCMVDLNGNHNGLYSLNNQLYLQINDTRCP